MFTPVDNADLQDVSHWTGWRLKVSIPRFWTIISGNGILTDADHGSAQTKENELPIKNLFANKSQKLKRNIIDIAKTKRVH